MKADIFSWIILPGLQMVFLSITTQRGFAKVMDAIKQESHHRGLRFEEHYMLNAQPWHDRKKEKQT